MGSWLSFLLACGVGEAQRSERAPKGATAVPPAPTANPSQTNVKPDAGPVVKSAATGTPIPDRLRPEVARAEILGRAIYTNDMLAAWGSDAMLAAKLPNSDQCRGWITRRQKDVWTVHFIGKDGGLDAELCAVDFAEFAPKAGKLRAWTKPQPLGAELAAMYRALQTATKSPQFIRRTDNYNPVVLPGALVGQPGWLVYLLAATTDPKEVIVGGHYCMRVSADGATLLETRPLSKSFLVLPKERDTAGLFVTHLISDTPIETHVFLSLLHGHTLFVGTSDRMIWRVADGTITYTGVRVKPEGESTGKPKP
jgi:hypothetical protein